MLGRGSQTWLPLHDTIHVAMVAWDKVKVLAGAILMGAILLFYVNIFLPRFIPPYLRLGVPPHATHVLLIGSDFTYDRVTHQIAGHTRGRSDTIMLIQLNPLEDRVNILSIPRDTFVTIPGYGQRKINAAFSLGGLDLCKRTVTAFTGIPIHHTVVVNPYGLAKVVDTMGGMWIDVEKDMHYVDHWGHLYIDLKKGRQKLSGDQVQGYLRFRQEARGDLGRIERQQNFISVLAKNVARPLVFWRAPSVIKTLRNAIYSDLSSSELLRIANFLRHTASDSFHFHTVPGHTMVGQDGASLYGADWAELEIMLEKDFGGVGL